MIAIIPARKGSKRLPRTVETPKENKISNYKRTKPLRTNKIHKKISNMFKQTNVQ